MTTKKSFHLLINGLLLSAIIALISVLFLAVETEITALFWEILPKYFARIELYYFVLCLVGAIILILIQKSFGKVHQTAHEAMSELKLNKTVDYSGVFKNLLAALVVLVFGAGVGPEAALLSAIIALSVRQADKLRYIYFQFGSWEELSFLGKIKFILSPFKYTQTYDADVAPADGKKIKMIANSVFILNGLVVFFTLNKAMGHPSFITRLGESNWVLQNIWLVVPALIIGAVVGLGYKYFSKLLSLIIKPLKDHQAVLTLIGAAFIYLFVVETPRLLFSGQTFMHLIPTFGTDQAWQTLLIAALLKLVFLQLCLQTGWIGGDIFPAIFSAVLFGFVTAQFFPGIDTLFIVAVVATSCSTQILDSIWVPGIFIALFFPMNLWPAIAVVLLLEWIIKNKILAPRKNKLSQM